MKKSIILLSIAVITVISVIISCQKKENKYSCNDKIEKFVASQEGEFVNISRADLCQYSPDTMRAIYNSLTPENKMQIWIEKLNYMIDNDTLSEAEKNYLQTVKGELNINIFDGDSIILHTFVDPIKVNLANSGWTEDKIGLGFSLPYTLREWLDYYSRYGEATSNCNCGINTINHCWNVCGYIPGCSNRGCGWFGAEICRGNCS